MENRYLYECGSVAGLAKCLLIFLIKYLSHVKSHLRKLCLQRERGEGSRGWGTAHKSFRIMIGVNSIKHLGQPHPYGETML